MTVRQKKVDVLGFRFKTQFIVFTLKMKSVSKHDVKKWSSKNYGLLLILLMNFRQNKQGKMFRRDFKKKKKILDHLILG